MGKAKDILVKVIPSKVANEFVKKHHYSGKVVNNSSLHFGCFLGGKLGGVMSYGSPLDKRKVLSLVEGTLWNEMLELNRMAFSDLLPRNSESRCLAVSFKLLKKNAPHIKWILSFSDGTQCGDGTIYRASGFVLTQVRESIGDLWRLPKHLHYLSKGEPVVHRITIQCKTSSISHWVERNYNDINTPLSKLCANEGGELMRGFQNRYIKLLHPNLKLNCEILPFSKIDEMGAGMYKGEKITLAERRKQALEAKGDDASDYQSEERRCESDPNALLNSEKTVKNG